MEGIELRDFAFEDVAQAPVHRRTIELPVKKEVKQADKSALRRFWSTHVRLTIEEAACRDHLALERTFLAYIRTASAYAQFGVTIAQLFRLNIKRDGLVITPETLKVGKALGATIEVIAIVIMVLGTAYFFKQQTGIVKGMTTGRGYEVYAMLIMSLALFVVIFGLLIGADAW